MIEILTKELALEYQRKAAALPDNGLQDIGERRILRQEVQKRFGLLEVEAINLINGFYTDVYMFESRRRAEKLGVTGGNQNEDEFQRSGRSVG